MTDYFLYYKTCFVNSMFSLFISLCTKIIKISYFLLIPFLFSHLSFKAKLFVLHFQRVYPSFSCFAFYFAAFFFLFCYFLFLFYFVLFLLSFFLLYFYLFLKFCFFFFCFDFVYLYCFSFFSFFFFLPTPNHLLLSTKLIRSCQLKNGSWDM